jgi:tRNA-specific 2-thiouridylase
VQKIVNSKDKSELHKAVDHGKDQSYFLFATTQEQLDFLHFPLGGFNKERTRKLAENYGLEVANKPDSQDICFVPNGDYASVIKKHRPNSFKAGELIHIETKKVLGTHEGIINFTLGQRRGLGIAYPHPLYVIKIDPQNNQVFVGEEHFLDQQIFTIRECNWLIDLPQIGEKFEAEIRIRSTAKEHPATIEILANNCAKIMMKSMTRAITPGQAGVVYIDNRVAGGGWIEKIN